MESKAYMNGPIIIYEDDTDDQDIYQDILSDLAVKNKIIMFNNGEEVIHYLETTSDNPFIIISDINIPKMNGLELRRRINQDDYLREKSIPFVFLSTTANKKVVEEAYRLTVQGFFVKQITVSAIKVQFALILEYWRQCKHTNAL
jgi:CheY-like chemotaxis protein